MHLHDPCCKSILFFVHVATALDLLQTVYTFPQAHGQLTKIMKVRKRERSETIEESYWKECRRAHSWLVQSL